MVSGYHHTTEKVVTLRVAAQELVQVESTGAGGGAAAAVYTWAWSLACLSSGLCAAWRCWVSALSWCTADSATTSCQCMLPPLQAVAAGRRAYTSATPPCNRSLYLPYGDSVMLAAALAIHVFLQPDRTL